MSPKPILLIDSHPVHVDILKEYFHFKQVTLQIVHSAQNALDLLGSDEFDVVITELNLPEIDGIELIKRIRQDKKLEIVPIVVLTTRAMNEDRIESLEAGATLFLAKPTPLARLLTEVQRLAAYS